MRSTLTHRGFFLVLALSLLSWICNKKIIFQWLCRESGCIHITAVDFNFTESQKSKSDSFESGILLEQHLPWVGDWCVARLVSALLNSHMSLASVLPAMRAGVFGDPDQKRHLVGMWNEEWQLCVLEIRRGKRWWLKLLSFSPGPTCHVAMTLCLFHYPLWTQLHYQVQLRGF